MHGQGAAGVSALSGLWVLVFAVDALRPGGAREHQLGAVALGLLFLTLVVSELRSYRRRRDEDVRA